MKSKVGKIITIILICLLLAICIGLGVFYIIDKEQAKEYLQVIINFINQPLPIVGVTTGAVLLFVWRLVVSLNYGKNKIQSYDQKLHEIEKAKDDLLAQKDLEINELKKNNAELKGYLFDICNLSTNIKIKNYGKEHLGYGEEVDSETKAN